MNRKLWALVLRIYALGIKSAFEQMLNKLEDDLRAIWRAALSLSVIDLINAILDLLTGWAGIILTIPDLGMMEFTLETARAEKAHNRLIRVDDAIRGVYHCQTAAITFWTGTGPNDLHSAVVTGFARICWRIFKRIKFIRSALKVTTEAELVELYVKSLLGRIKLFRIVGLAIAIVACVLKIGTIIVTFTLNTEFANLKKFILPQDSDRIRGRFTASGLTFSVAKRLNDKTGPDHVV